MNYAYILLMSIAFLFKFGGHNVNVISRYILALILILTYFIHLLRSTKKIKRTTVLYVRWYVYPVIGIFCWSIFVWCINMPEDLTFKDFTRMTSSILYLIIAVLSAIAAVQLLGKSAIKYSVWAIFIGVMVNFLYTNYLLGFGNMKEYLLGAFDSTDYLWGSSMWRYSGMLEIHDSTFATGLYLIYYICIAKDINKRERIFYTILLLVSAYIGFKRTVLNALVLTILVSWIIDIIDRTKIKYTYIIHIVGFGFIVLSLAYIIIIKNGVFYSIVNNLDIELMGRQEIYKTLSDFYEISPFYIGKGFAYVQNHVLYITGFAPHNTLARMYAEIGSILFIAWEYWYFIGVPKRMFYYYNKKIAKMILLLTFYLFLMYFMDNAIDYYCIQFSFIVIPFAICTDFKEHQTSLKQEVKAEKTMIS